MFNFKSEFLQMGIMLSMVNLTWVTLIPKLKNPTCIEDYKPIIMVGCMYNIISKLISIRLKFVLASIIDKSQLAFEMDRQILDGVMVANEAITWLKKRKERCAMLKLDYQKAYDLVTWCFVEHVMRGLGFGEKWIRWIMACTKTVTILVLVNGSPLQPTPMEKGLMQGDPFSPYSF